MAEAPMFINEEEFRREWEESHDLELPILLVSDSGSPMFPLEYRPGDPHFDMFLSNNYDRIPNIAWVTDYSGEEVLHGGPPAQQRPDFVLSPYSLGRWQILSDAHYDGYTRAYYADLVVQEIPLNSTNWGSHASPQPPTQAEDDARHQRQMDYIATLPVEPVDPTPRYNSQTPEYVTAYDLGVTPSPLGEPPEYLPPVPVYTTPEYCETDVCPENAVWGQPHCQECARLRRSGWRDFYEDWKSGKLIPPDADAPEWIKHKTYAEFLEDFAYSKDGTPWGWNDRWQLNASVEWTELGFDENLLETIGNMVDPMIEEEYELYMNPPYDSPTYAYADQPYPDGEGRRMKTRKSNSCRRSKTKKRKYHKKMGKTRKKRKYHKKRGKHKKISKRHRK